MDLKDGVAPEHSVRASLHRSYSNQERAWRMPTPPGSFGDAQRPEPADASRQVLHGVRPSHSRTLPTGTDGT